MKPQLTSDLQSNSLLDSQTYKRQINTENQQSSSSTRWPFSPPCKGIQDSLGLWILHNGFRIPATGFRILLSVELGFRILSLTEFRILRVLFRIPKPRIPDFKATIFWIAESGFLYMGRPFDPGRLEKLRVFVDIIYWAPWISLVQSTKLPSIFLKAQP